MNLLCRGDLWLSDVSNDNIIYCAGFLPNNEEMYQMMLDEAERRKYNTVMLALDRDDPYEFIDIWLDKPIRSHYIKLVDLFVSEKGSPVQGGLNDFECARRVIEYLESNSVDSEIFRIIVDKMWPEFSFFSEAMSCISIEPCSQVYDILKFRNLEENGCKPENCDLGEVSKILSYQSDAINNTKVLSLVRKIHKINHPSK